MSQHDPATDQPPQPPPDRPAPPERGWQPTEPAVRPAPPPRPNEPDQPATEQR
jgi:hypothetical protein